MDKNMFFNTIQEYKELGMSNLIDYDKFYLYSIVTHSTAIEGSTMTEVENQVLLKRAWQPGERAWKRVFHNICIDKMKALFPIKKEYVKKIFDGSKAYEYRKSFCSLEVDTIVIYESRGKGLVVGEFEIADRLCDTPRNIWERTKGYAGISESDFFSYFEGRDKACAYVVGNVNVFLKPKTLQDYGINVVPQNFCYIR